MYNFERQLQQDLSLNRKFDSMYVQSLWLDSLKAKIHIYKHTLDPVLKKEYHEDLLYLYGISIRVKQKWFTYSRSQIEAKILLKNLQ
jgi:hypothetical protein